MANEVKLTYSFEDDGTLRFTEKLGEELLQAMRAAQKLSDEKIDFDVDPALKALQELQRQLRRIEAAFDRAQAQVNFARARNEIERTTQSARALARAESTLAARGKLLIDFAKKLPPELAKSSKEMDRLERETKQAAAAFRLFQGARKNVSGLVSSIGQLRTVVSGFLAILAVRQILSFGRSLVRIGAAAVETKKKFDSLLPALTAFTGSTELAAEVAARLVDTSERLKTPLADLISPFTKITAATKETNLTLAEQSDLFEAALLTTKAFGLSTEETGRLVTGFAQVAGKGTLSMEELRQQIGEVAFNALPALAKALNTTVPLLIESVVNGAISAEVALRGFAKGLRDANEAAGLAQLETLKGDLSDLARVAENAEVAFADELEPGLRLVIQAVTDLLETNPQLIQQLGGLGSAALAGLSGVVEAFNGVGQALKGLGVDALATAQLLEALPAGAFTGTESLAAAYRGIGNALVGVEAQAALTFQALEDGARIAALGSKKSAEEIGEDFKAAFRFQAEAAGLAAEDIERTEKTLAARLGVIAEASVDARVALGRERTREIERNGEVSIETEERIARAIFTIERLSIARRVDLLSEIVIETAAAGAQRVAEEARAAKEIEIILAGVVATAKGIAIERIAVDQQTTDTIVQIERRAAERIAVLLAKAQEELAKSGADREKITEELTGKIVAIERKAADDIIKEQERIAEAAEKAAERAIAAEQKKRAALQSSIEKLREVLRVTNEIADGAEGEGGGFARQREQVRGLGADLSDLLDDFEAFGQSTFITEAGQDLAVGFQTLKDQLAATAGSFGDFFSGAQQAGQAATGLGSNLSDDLGAALTDTLDAISGLPIGAQEAVAALVQEFAGISDASQATADDAERFRDRLRDILGNLDVLDVGPIQAGLNELRISLGESSDAAQEAATAQTEAGETTGAAYDAATNTIRNVEKATEDVGEAAQDAGEVISQAAGKGKASMEELRIETKATATATEGLGKTAADTGEALAQGIGKSGASLEELRIGAEGAAAGVGALATAAAPLGGALIQPEEPERVAALGVAAGTASPLMTELALPVEQIALALPVFAEALPSIVELFPALVEPLARLVTLLSEGELQEILPAVATALDQIAIPLPVLAETLPAITAAIEPLPAALKAFEEAASPTFELVQQAADDARFQVVGQGLQEISDALPDIPAPLEKITESLKTVAGLKDELDEALAQIAARLRELGDQALLEGLKELSDRLDELIEQTEAIDEVTKSISGTIEKLTEQIPDLIFQLGNLTEEAGERLAPALETLASAAEGAATNIGLVKSAATEAKVAVEEFRDVASAAFDKVATRIRAATADLQAFNAEQRTAIDLAGQLAGASTI